MPLSSGDALGEFMDDTAIHKGDALNYRGEIGNRSWKRDAVATLVHEMGHEEEETMRAALFLKFVNPTDYDLGCCFKGIRESNTHHETGG